MDNKRRVLLIRDKIDDEHIQHYEITNQYMIFEHIIE